MTRTDTRHWMEVAYLEGSPDKVLTLAASAERGTFAGIGHEQIKASQTRLAALQAQRSVLSRRFAFALVSTVTLVGFSVLVLSITPLLARAGALGGALAIGVAWSWLCLASYVGVVKSALV